MLSYCERERERERKKRKRKRERAIVAGMFMIIREGSAGGAGTGGMSAPPERTAKQVELCMHVLPCAFYRHLSLKYSVLNIICLKGKVSHFCNAKIHSFIPA